MPKQKKHIGTAKKVEGTKGIIGGARETFDNVKQSLHDLLYGKEAEVSPGKMADINRKSGETISSVLKVVDWTTIKNDKDISQNEYKELKQAVEALAYKFDHAPTINDNISELDVILLYIAQTMNTAAVNGRRNQVQWCINALSTGVLEYRADVPRERANERDDIIAAYTEYMKNYVNLIDTYEIIEINDRSIKEDEKDIAAKEKQLDDLLEKLNKAEETPEGQFTLSRIHQGLKLLPGDAEIAAVVDEADRLKSDVFSVKAHKSSLEKNNNGLLAEVQGFKNALRDRPMPNQVKLAGEYDLALQRINAQIEKRLDIAAEISSIRDAREAELKSILSGSSAQGLAAKRARAVDDLLNPQANENDDAVLQDALQRQRRKREAEQRIAANKAKLEDAMAQVQSNLQQAENAHIDFNTLDSENTSTNVDTNENTDENSQYNYNS